MNSPTKILVIDDNDDDRLLYRRTLKKIEGRNYVLLEAGSGEEGVEKVKEDQPDCVLLDYSLPGYNGIQILGDIHRNFPFMPVIMMTGQGNENVAVEAMQKGAVNYISKSAIATQDNLDHIIQMAIEHCLMQKRIHEQRTSLEVFTHALAHDLKEPVRTIQSFAELITQSNTFPDKTLGYFQHIQHAADRMNMLIDTVFLYTRLDEPGKMMRENCDTTSVLMEVKENLDKLIREHDVSIQFRSLPPVYINRMQFIQLLQNLISNAIRHIRGKVIITLDAKEQGNNWLFSVKDNGPGIASANLHKIFEPFRRLKEDAEGTGLGLAICKKIVEGHGGRMWAESQPENGTTFFFTLPKAADMGASTDYASPKASAAGFSSSGNASRRLANILLVDDSRADIEITQFRVIERPGVRCNFLVARNGEEALEMLQDRLYADLQIDLMLVDINMPEMDGFELLERMRDDAKLKSIPVVMCTGSTYDKDIQKAKSLGAIGYLTKPINFEQLKKVIDETSVVELYETGGSYSLLSTAAA